MQSAAAHLILQWIIVYSVSISLTNFHVKNTNLLTRAQGLLEYTSRRDNYSYNT